ncbi:Histone-lysine N-methyltransferase 2C [Armadillidium vulgare]|nr:Histone-lysine N-methyltransferase 2C [Armadillidium vulgare]
MQGFGARAPELQGFGCTWSQIEQKNIFGGSQCFAHYMCAFWSNGVELTSDDSIACVDKAVVAASERKCFSCKKLGASIPCRVCRLPGDEIVCVICDKAYHAVCARPQGLTQSRIDWKCKICRVCGDCGSRTPGNGLSSRWHSSFTVCDSCYQLRNKGLACPVCRKAYRANMQKGMAQCSLCKRHVHNHCDEEADLNVIHAKWVSDHSYEFICCVCRSTPNAKLQAGPLFMRSPDREDSQESIASEDSVDTEMLIDDPLISPVKPGGTSENSTSLSSSSFSTSSIVSSSTCSTPLNLSFSSIQSSNYFERTGHSGTNTSSLTRGKPFGLARRGSVLFPRMRGAVNKYNLDADNGLI